ncbi:PaaI family thioesterase [soil metagenome]
MDMVQATIPPDASWQTWDQGDPFEAANTRIFRATAFEPSEEELVRIGCRILPANCNFLGGGHGGFIATLLDIAMGRNVLAATGTEGAPTVSMTIDFLRGAAAGDWLESRARLLRRTRRLAFSDAVLIGPKGIVARGNGVFAIPQAAA